MAATTILLKVKRYLRQDIRLLRIHSGAKYFGCEPAFHTDFKEDYCFTFVLFTNRYWNTNWGGEFIAQNPITNEYNYVPYIPNNGVLVPSNWEHTGTLTVNRVILIRYLTKILCLHLLNN